MNILFYCTDGTKSSGLTQPKKDAFYKDSVGSWHMTGIDSGAIIDSACIPLYDEIRMVVYSRQEFDENIFVQSQFIYDAGIDAEAQISKAQFEKIILALSGRKKELHQALYWQDYSFLVSNVQTVLGEIISIAGEFYKSFCEYDSIYIPEENFTGIRRADSPETRFSTLLMHMVFVRMHSVLDYLVKLAFEVDRESIDYENYPKLRGKNAQFGDCKKTSIFNIKGTVFEECEFIRKIETIRTRIIHDGHLSPNQWIYEVWENSVIIERYILFPDMNINPGSFDSSINRRSFYGGENKFNEMLPGIIKEFYARTNLTLLLIKGRLAERRRW